MMTTTRLMAALAALLAGGTGAPDVTVYVSPDGNDAWSGKLPAPNAARTDGPLATLERARDAVRAMKKASRGLPGPVQVQIRGGRYGLSKPLEFAPEDSGAEGKPVTYAAFETERPVISGGVRIEGWRRQDNRLWVAEVPWVREGGRPFFQLFVDGARRPRARTPDEGNYFYTRRLKMGQGHHPPCLGLRYSGNDIGDWKDLDRASIVLFHNWVNSYNRIGKIDRDTQQVTFARPAGLFFLGPEVRYYVEGVLEALDAPGEWHLDAARGLLYYQPMPGEDMARAEVIAPRVPSPLVRAAGTPGAGPFVEHLVFRGLSFQHAGADLSPGYPHSVQGAHTQKGAFFAAAMRHSLLEDCEFTRLGEHAVSLREGCASNVVTRCRAHDLGGGGIYLSEGAPKDKTDAWLTSHNRIENNLVHDGGILFRAGCGVFLGGSASHNQILHNEIFNLSWMGIHLGWSWTGRAPAYTHHNEVAWNHIHHLGNGVLNDIGGIYTLGVSPGTVLHHNLIHDVTRFERGQEGYGGWGIYLDAGSSEIRVEDNIVYNTRDGGFHAHCDGYPYGDTVVNNIFARSDDQQMMRNNVKEAEGNHVHLERNIICNRGPKMYGGGNWKDGSKFTAERNCYWSETAAEPDFYGKTFAEWQKLGRDREGIVANPLFVDASRNDYRPRPDSPALKLGFRPIDMSRVGLQGSAEWRARPRTVRLRTVERPPASAIDDGSRIEEDFEDYDPGERPVQALPPEGGTSVDVTDRDPPGGKRCARFTDAAGAAAWKPHWFVTRKPGTGRVRMRCAVKNDAAQPATFELELRDWHGGSRIGDRYLTGPHLRFAPDGTVQAAGGPGGPAWVPAGKYDPGKWLRLEIEFEEGKDRPKSYTLRLEGPGGTAVREGLPFRSADFTLCTWCGFSGTDTKAATFYLDDFKIE